MKQIPEIFIRKSSELNEFCSLNFELFCVKISTPCPVRDAEGTAKYIASLNVEYISLVP
jgi:predicted metal-binding transcription factor (methanogenesis marker protein 9)